MHNTLLRWSRRVDTAWGRWQLRLLRAVLGLLRRRRWPVLHALLHVMHLHLRGPPAVVELEHVNVALLTLHDVGVVGHDAAVHAALLLPPSLMAVAGTVIVASTWVAAAAVAPPTFAVATAATGAVAVVVAALAGPAASVATAALRCPVETDVLPRLCRCKAAVG